MHRRAQKFPDASKRASMSGQIAFSRTLRSLDSDRFRGSWVGLLFSALLLAAWLWWMFTPRVPEFSPLSESASLTWNLDAQQVSVAGLPPDAFQRIHLGQAARLSWEDRTIIAQVSLLPPS